MKEVVAVLQGVETFSSENVEKSLESFIAEKGYGMGKVMNALRLGLLGISNGPGVADVCEVVGKQETIARIENVISKL